MFTKANLIGVLTVGLALVASSALAGNHRGRGRGCNSCEQPCVSQPACCSVNSGAPAANGRSYSYEPSAAPRSGRSYSYEPALASQPRAYSRGNRRASTPLWALQKTDSRKFGGGY